MQGPQFEQDSGHVNYMCIGIIREQSQLSTGLHIKDAFLSVANTASVWNMDAVSDPQTLDPEPMNMTEGGFGSPKLIVPLK